MDAIIVSSSSEKLKQTIIQAAGTEVESAYEAEHQRNPKSILISTSPGQLPCKRIYFLKWIPDLDEAVLRQSIYDFISTVIQNIIASHYQSIAFPAIGFGEYHCSSDVVVDTMVSEIKKELRKRALSLTVKFVIQPGKPDVYDLFCKQVLASDKGTVLLSILIASRLSRRKRASLGLWRADWD